MPGDEALKGVPVFSEANNAGDGTKNAGDEDKKESQDPTALRVAQ
jgi:hypothetical protein